MNTRVFASGIFAAALMMSAGSAALSAPAAPTAEERKKMDSYLETVRTFADNVLKHGRDHYGPKQTPLFVDSINVDTLKPPVWKRNGEKWILSNLASQQVLLRTLVGLTQQTGDRKYRDAAVQAVRYAFDNLRDVSGMLYWGGHHCYDALGDRTVGESLNQEFKHHYPFWEFLWEIDPAVTRGMVEGSWGAHILNWANLDFNRHGKYGTKAENVWDNEYKGGPVPFEGKGLTFMMSGTDLMCAAASLAHFSGDPKPLVWAERLGSRYADARDPKTGLGSENFSDPETHRMEKQFPQFEGRFRESGVTDIYGSRYTFCAAAQLRMGEMLGEKGRKFTQWGLEDLRARAKHGYDRQTNTFQAMLIDGTPLSPEDRKLDGYVTVDWLSKRPATSRYFFAYCLACRISKDPLMWDMAACIGRGIGLGSLEDGNPSTENSDPVAVFGLLELWRATNDRKFLSLAEQVADNAIARQFHKGFFVPGKDYVIANFDDPLPLALLHLRAEILGEPVKPPAYWLSRGFFHCGYDRVGRTYDHRVLFTLKRGDPEP